MAPLDGLENKASCCQSEVLSHISTFDYARGPSMTGRRGLWGFRYDTMHPKINHYKMRFRFMSAKWNAATRYSAHPFTTKTVARVHFFCLNYPRISGWYQARVHPFSSGNGKGDAFIMTCYLALFLASCLTYMRNFSVTYIFLILTCVLCVLTFLTITFYLAIFLLPCIFIYSGILSDIF